MAKGIDGWSPAAQCWLWLEVAAQQVAAGVPSRARQTRRQAVATARIAGGRRLELWAWARIGGDYERESKHGPALEAYESALRLAPRDGSLRAALQLRVADARFRSADSSRAEQAYEEARRLWTLLAVPTPGLAATLIGLGKTARNRGRFDTANHAMAEAVRVAQAVSTDHPQVAIALYEWAILADWQDDLEQAARRFTTAYRLYHRHGIRDHHLAALLMGRGNVARNRGDLIAAEADFLAAHRIFSMRRPRSIFVAWSLQGLGVTAWDRGQWDLAEQRFGEALEILQTLGALMDAALVLEKRGLVAHARGDLAAARRYLEQALRIVESQSPESKFPPRLRTNLGQLVMELGDEAEAERLLSTARRQWQQRVPGSLDHAATLHLLGELALQRGGLQEATRWHRKALAIRSVLAPHTAVEAESLHALAVVWRRAGRRGKALGLFYDAIAALEGQVGHSGASDESRARFRSRHRAMYQDLASLLVERGDPAGAFEVLERYRTAGLTRLVEGRRSVLRRDLPADLQRERRQIARRLTLIRRELESLDATDANRAKALRLVARLRELHQERQGILARMHIEAPSTAALEAPRPVRLSDLHGILAPDSLVLGYDVQESGASLYVVDASGSVVLHHLGVDEKTLRERVTRLRLLLEGEGPDGAGRGALIHLAAELYELLVKPAESRLERASRIIVVPDGVLHTLPFAALVRRTGDASQTFLAEWKPTLVAPSLDALRDHRGRRRRTTGEGTARNDDFELVAFGDPVLSQGESAATGLAPLAGARGEARTVSRLFRHGRVHLGRDATEARAKRVGIGTGVVHFATHGIVDDRLPLDSALVLAPSPGSQGQGEDGFLRAWEIMEEMRLDAQLVTLSACDTGRGEELAGTGLLGLTRAFQHAGAGAVLASLWQVRDRSSAALMVRFYEGLRAGLPLDEALRQAQLALLRGRVTMSAQETPSGLTRLLLAFTPLSSRAGTRRHDFSHPHHWAAFQIYGAAQ